MSTSTDTTHNPADSKSPSTKISNRKRWEQKSREISRYEQQHNKDPAWFAHEKHMLCVTWAGRPVFSRYGDTTKLNAYMGVLSAIISNYHRMDDKVRCIVAGKWKFVFVEKGPLYFFAISSTDESVKQLRQQLDYVYSQILSVLTMKIHTMIESHGKYDVRGLLTGTQPLFMNLIDECDSNVCYLLDSVACLRLNRPDRAKITTILRKYRTKSLLYAIILAGPYLVSLVRGKDRALHPSDLLILTNFVNNSGLHQTESWTPVCLPQFNPQGYLYALVSHLIGDMTLVLLTLDTNELPKLKTSKENIVASLQAQNSLNTVQRSLSNGFFSVDEVGTVPELVHFLYKSGVTSQSVCPKYTPPFHTPQGKKALFRHYQHIFGRVCARGSKRHMVYYEVTTTATILGWVRQDEFELYAVLSPLVTKVNAITACNDILRWIKREESTLFIM